MKIRGGSRDVLQSHRMIHKIFVPVDAMLRNEPFIRLTLFVSIFALMAIWE